MDAGDDDWSVHELAMVAGWIADMLAEHEASDPAAESEPAKQPAPAEGDAEVLRACEEAIRVREEGDEVLRKWLDDDNRSLFGLLDVADELVRRALR